MSKDTMCRQSDDAIRNMIAREIWRYQECEAHYGDFDRVSDATVGMGALIKRTAIDQAELIRAVVLNSRVLRERILFEAANDSNGVGLVHAVAKALKDGFEGAFSHNWDEDNAEGGFWLHLSDYKSVRDALLGIPS